MSRRTQAGDQRARYASSVIQEGEQAIAGGESITTIICAFSLERFEQTLASVRSVLAQVPHVPSIVVVVDHNEPLEQKLRDALDSTVVIVPNQGPRGLSGARNTGIAHATGATVAFLDDDAIAPPGWLATLQAEFADPRVMAVGGHAVPIWSGRPPDHFPEEFLWVVGCSYRGLARSGPVRNVLGCNMAFRAEVFDEVGGFDPAIGQLESTPLKRCDETELCIRARRRFPDAEVRIVEGATIEHEVSPARERFSYFWRRCFWEGVSKALLRRLTDERALDTERQYAIRTLRTAVGRDLRSIVALRAPGTALLRLAWVCVGFAAASFGYAYGSVYYRIRPPVSSPPPVGHARGAVARRYHDVNGSSSRFI
jgi:O-antigen biosynthesis protein